MKTFKLIPNLLFLAGTFFGSVASAQTYTIGTIAGDSLQYPPTYCCDGGPATAALLNNPEGVAFDPTGNLYIADFGNNRIRSINSSGTISTYAGIGTAGYSGDGGAASSAEVSSPTDVATDATGNIYIADRQNFRIREINTSGIISTIAGIGANGFSGDGGPATLAEVRGTNAIFVNSTGIIFIGDTRDNIVRMIRNDSIFTIAGNTAGGYNGDGGPATSAELNGPYGVTGDASGNIYIGDYKNQVIRMVDNTGNISTFAGNHAFGAGYSGDGGAATSAELNNPERVAVDAAGDVYISDDGNFVVRMVNSSGTISTYAGMAPTGGFTGDGGPATLAEVNTTYGMTQDVLGNIYFADGANNRIRQVNTLGIISTVAGSNPSIGDGGPATSAILNTPTGVVLDAASNLYVTDEGNYRVRIVAPSTTISTFAGIGVSGYSGDSGPATSAELNNIYYSSTDAAGNLYIADYGSNVVRMVNTLGTISTFAGNGFYGYSGDGGPATLAEFANPGKVSFDAAGNAYIPDESNNVVRKVDLSGMISTVAGNYSLGSGYSGDAGLATSAQLSSPNAVSFDLAGNMYISDGNNYVVRKVDGGDTISTVAGNHAYGYGGDGGPATSAQLSNVTSVEADSYGKLFIADYGNNVIRMVNNSGTISTIAGNNTPGFSGDGGPATSAQLNFPNDIAVDPLTNNVYLADSYNHRVRLLTLNTFTGITKTTAPGEINVYPNPTTGRVTIQISNIEQGIMNIEVYNVYGQSVVSDYQSANGHTSNYQIDLSGQPNGIYFVRLSKQDGTTVSQKKVVIQN